MTSAPVQFPVIPLRPLGLGDVFQASFSIYRHRFAQFLLLGLIPSLAGLAVTLAAVAIGATAMLPFIVALVQGRATPSGFPVAAFVAFMVLIIIGGLLISAATYASAGLIALGVTQVNRGQSPTVGSLWRDARGIAGHVLGLTAVFIGATVMVGIVVSVVIFLAVDRELPWLSLPLIVALAVAAILVQARLGLTTSVLGIEGLGAINSLKRSWQLTEGSALRVFGYLLLVNLLVSAAMQVVSGLVQSMMTPFATRMMNDSAGADLLGLVFLIPWLLAAMVVTPLLSAITAPFVAIFTGVLYIDIRRRREAVAGQPLFS